MDTKKYYIAIKIIILKIRVKFYDVTVKALYRIYPISRLLEIYLIWANIRKDYTKVNVMGMNVFLLT